LDHLLGHLWVTFGSPLGHLWITFGSPFDNPGIAPHNHGQLDENKMRLNLAMVNLKKRNATELGDGQLNEKNCD
jgi:hypothetical protein